MKALRYVWVAGTYSSDTPVKRIQHMSVAECATLFWRNGLPAISMLKCVDYMGMLDAVSAPQGFRNVAKNVSRLLVDEVVYRDELSGNGRRWMMPPEQKSFVLMRDIVHKIYQPGQLLLDPFCGNAFYREGGPLLDNV